MQSSLSGFCDWHWKCTEAWRQDKCIFWTWEMSLTTVSRLGLSWESVLADALRFCWNNIEIILWDNMAGSGNTWELPVCVIIYVLHCKALYKSVGKSALCQQREKMKAFGYKPVYPQLSSLLSSQRIAVFYDIITHSISPLILGLNSANRHMTFFKQILNPIDIKMAQRLN